LKKLITARLERITQVIGVQDVRC